MLYFCKRIDKSNISLTKKLTAYETRAYLNTHIKNRKSVLTNSFSLKVWRLKKTRKDIDKMFTFMRGLLCYLVSHGYAKHLRERDT